MSASPLEFLAGVDWRKPNAKDANGAPCTVLRCRIPMALPAVDDRFVVVDQVERDADAIQINEKLIRRDIDELGPENQDRVDNEPLGDDDATLDPGSSDEVEFDRLLVSGIASSTSVDFYGTEMSLRALKMMAVQMTAGQGIPYLPRHNRGLSGPIEWDEVIGRTVHAEVVPVDGDQISKPHNPSETHFILRAVMELYRDEPIADELRKRLARGEPIGQSIGGWFTQIQIFQNDDGEVERVIVLGVDLDHLAVTRAPANPDANAIVSLRDQIQRSIDDQRASALASHLEEEQVVAAPSRLVDRIRGAMADRHVISVTDNEDGTVSLRLAAASSEEVSASSHDEDEENMDALAGGDIYDSHQQIEAACARFEISDGRAVVSWDADAAPEGILSGVRTALAGGLGVALRDVLSMVPDVLRDAVPFRSYPLADEGMAWSWDTQEENEVLGDPPDWERYRLAHGWEDPDADMETKARYKLPHHKMINGRLRTVLRGAQAGIAALNGARGGVDIPDADREATYNHLARHVREFDVEPAPLRSSDEIASARADAAAAGASYDLDAWLDALEDDAPGVMDHAAWLTVRSREGAASVTLAADDARRSAPTDPPTTAAIGGTSEESAMGDTLTLAAIRAMFDEALTPLVQRVEVLESGSDKTAPHENEQEDDELVLLRAKAEAAEARAKAAEHLYAESLVRSHRVGRNTGLAMPAGPAGEEGMRGLIERAKSDGAAPMAAVIERSLPRLDAPTKDRASRAELEAMLRAACISAENCGLITDPNLRAGWQ